MPSYEHEITPQTQEALDGLQKEVADERGLNSRRYIDKIIAGKAIDYYQKFKQELLKPVLNSSRPEQAKPWVDDINVSFDRATRTGRAAQLSPDSKRVAALCHGFEMKLIEQGQGEAEEADVKAAARKLYAALGPYIAEDTEEVRRRSLSFVSSAEGARR